MCLPGAHQRVWWGQELLKEGLAAPSVSLLSHLRQKLLGADCKGSLGDEHFCRETAGATWMLAPINTSLGSQIWMGGDVSTDTHPKG